MAEDCTVRYWPTEKAMKAAAVGVAAKWAMVDGERHKQWVIDQMLRRLLGDEGYRHWVDQWHNAQEDDEVFVEWDTGVAP